MSVINNVLKDLETRESRFTPIEISSVGQTATSTGKPAPLLLIGLLLLLLAAAAWIYLQDQWSHPANLPAPALVVAAPEAAVSSVPPAKESTVVAAVVSERPAANQIVGLQIRETETDMRLEFALREKVVAYLKQRGENRFGYHLRDIESQIIAPLISDNRWIRKLSITASESGVDIIFETVADILVETRQKQVDGEPVWAINLHKSVASPVSEPVVEDAGESAMVESQPEAPMPASAAISPPQQTSIATLPAEVVRIDIKSTDPNAKSEQQLEYAAELVNSRRYADAESLLQGLLTGVEDYQARQHLLALYSHQKRVDRFRRLVRESMTAYPEDALFKTEYARSLFQGNAYRTVIQLFVNGAPVDANQQALLAASYQRLEQHQDAVKHYRLALVHDAGNAKNWIGLGISQEHTTALEDALDSYQQAAQLGTLNGRLEAFVGTRSSTLKQVLSR